MCVPVRIESGDPIMIWLYIDKDTNELKIINSSTITGTEGQVSRFIFNGVSYRL